MTLRGAAYPTTRRDRTADLYHGTRVEDPYRWLEDPDSPDTIAWTDSQNALTRSMLDGPLREGLRTELRGLYDYPRTSPPVPRHSRYFFTRNDGLQNQPVLYVQDGIDGTPRVLLDPNALSPDGTIALTGWEPSADGRLLAYAVSSGGSDWQDVHVRDVDTGADFSDHLRWAKFVTISWFADSSGFFYTRFPDNSSYHPAVYAHQLGAPQTADRVVFGPPADPEIIFEVDQSSDHRFLAITAFKGASVQTSVTVLRLGEPWWQSGEFQNEWRFLGARGDSLFFRTNLGAPRGRIVAIERDGRPREVVGECADSLADARLVSGRLAALYLHNACSRVRLYEIHGGDAGEVALPALGSVTEMTGEADGDELFLRFASFTYPPAVLRCDLRLHDLPPKGGSHRDRRHPDSSFRLQPEEWLPALAGRNTNEFETHQIWYPSRDGTRVSMFLVHRRGIERNGHNPVWLTGYGGFNINIVPDFDPGHLVWLERGGVLAVPNLRGGGEYGETWHQAGMLERKQNVFDDCVAAVEWLIAERYTRAGRVVLEGGSNGGLLVSAVLTQRPDLPGAVVCRVPVADMLRYHLFTVGRFWIPEYGCADDASQFEVLYAYSPLHRVRDDVAYPPVLITTAETDDRVEPGMARKLAARLQAARGGPALIRIERRAGHGAGKPVAKLIDEDADIYTFALLALNLEDRG